MRLKKSLVVVGVLGMALSGFAASVHQMVEGEGAYVGGQNAVKAGKMEVKEVEGASKGKVARVSGAMNQWGFVSYWFGLATPEGKSIIRFRVYVDETPTSTYGVYVSSKSGQKHIAKLKVPDDAKPGTFVDVDIPVEYDEDWSGVAFKNFQNNDKPSLWIDTVSTLIVED
jgi:hypothetical protein